MEGARLYLPRAVVLTILATQGVMNVPAYVVAGVQVTDPIGFETYKNAVRPVVEAYGGTFIARGGAIEVLDGDWKPSRLTLLKFDSVAQAKAWYDSPGYCPLKDIRSITTRTNILIVEGVQTDDGRNAR